MNQTCPYLYQREKLENVKSKSISELNLTTLNDIHISLKRIFHVTIDWVVANYCKFCLNL